MKAPLFFFLLFSFAYGVSVDLITGLPNDMVAGSVYPFEAKFNSNYAGEYKVWITVSGVEGNETFISGNCSEVANGSHLCLNPMVVGLNYANFSFWYHPYIAAGSYPVSVVFEIPQSVAGVSPAPSNSGGGSGGGAFSFPRPLPQIKEEPAIEEEKEEIKEPEKEAEEPVEEPKEEVKEPTGVAQEPKIVVEKVEILEVVPSEEKKSNILFWFVVGTSITLVGGVVIWWVFGRK